MKNLIYILLVLFYPSFSYCQLDYYPPQGNHISDEQYQGAKYILENSYQQIKELVADPKDESQYTYADCWNLMVGYMKAGADNARVIKYLELAKEKNPKNFFFLFNHSKKENFSIYLGEYGLQALEEECQAALAPINQDEKPDVIIKKSLNQLLDRIHQNDQKYRGKHDDTHKQKQKALDQENLRLIDSLYAHYKKYMGESMVGESQKTIMWAVIQHSNLEAMEKYLPVIHQAVIEKELPMGPLRMLLDRVYWLKTGKQIFGSQSGIPFAEDALIEQVKKQYNL